jgi:hypothetical protein
MSRYSQKNGCSTNMYTLSNDTLSISKISPMLRLLKVEEAGACD